MHILVNRSGTFISWHISTIDQYNHWWKRKQYMDWWGSDIVHLMHYTQSLRLDCIVLMQAQVTRHFAIHRACYRIGYLSEILCLSLVFIALLAWPVCCCLLGGLTDVCWMVLQSWLWLERFLSVLRCLLTGVPLLVTHMYNCDTGVRVHTGKLWYTVCEWHKYNYNIWHIVRILVSPETLFVCETLIELPLFSDKLHQRSPAALPFQRGTAVMGTRSMVCRVSYRYPVW